MAEALIQHDARFSRQAQIIHNDLAQAQVIVAGTGMLGGFTALALAHCAAHVAVWDPDIVEDVNFGNQLWNAEHLGMPKVEALARMCAGFPLSSTHAPFPLETAPEEALPFDRADRKLVVVSGVDSLEVRAQLAQYALHHEADVFIDTRAMGELCVIYIVPKSEVERYLRNEPLKDADAPDVPCGLNGTAYMGSYVGGSVVARLNAYFSGKRVPFVTVEDVSTRDVLRIEYEEVKEK